MCSDFWLFAQHNPHQPASSQSEMIISCLGKEAEDKEKEEEEVRFADSERNDHGGRRKRSSSSPGAEESCRGLQPEYSWAADAATAYPPPLPHLLTLFIITNCKKTQELELIAPPRNPDLSWPHHLQRSQFRGSDHFGNLEQFNPGVELSGCEQLLPGGQCLSPGRLCRPRPLLLEPPREPGGGDL